RVRGDHEARNEHHLQRIAWGHSPADARYGDEVERPGLRIARDHSGQQLELEQASLDGPKRDSPIPTRPAEAVVKTADREPAFPPQGSAQVRVVVVPTVMPRAQVQANAFRHQAALSVGGAGKRE